MPDATVATRSVVVERELAHPPEKIWRALTQGALIEEWMMKNDFQPIVGHHFLFCATPMPHWNGIVDCEVLEVVPNERLSYAWRAVAKDASVMLTTVVTWTLKPTTRGALVRMEQSGFDADDEVGYRGATHGWPQYLDGLERVVATLA